jgi:polysaccharide chain length determinant protein (PEP-CTERM system associated)
MNALTHLLSRYGIIAWRRRWQALLLTWCICLLGWGIVALIPNQYVSSARLYVDTGAVLTPLLRGIALDSSQASDVDILQRTLLSRPNLEKLISKTDLDVRAPTPTDREALVQSLGTAIHILPQTRNLFTIEYADKNPKLARDVVQTIVTLFIESAVGTSREDMQGARVFLERQITAYETKLRAAERARAAFQVKYADVLPGSTGSSSRLDTAREQAALLKGQVIDATSRRDLLKQEMAATPPLLVIDAGGRSSGSAGGASPGLAEAERRLNLLRLRFTDQYPDVVAAQQLVASLRAGGGGNVGGAAGSVTAPRSVPNPVYDQLKVRLIDAESTLESLTRQAREASSEEDRLSAVVRGAPGVEAEYLNLNRDYEVLRKNYDELLARRESMRLGAAADEEADKVKLRIVEAPQIPNIPVGPKRVLLSVGVFAAGLGGGLGLVFLLVQFDGAFYALADLRGLGLPVLGGVSLQRRAAGYAGRLSFVASCLALFAVFGGVATYPLWQSHSAWLLTPPWL